MLISLFKNSLVVTLTVFENNEAGQCDCLFKKKHFFFFILKLHLDETSFV